MKSFKPIRILLLLAFTLPFNLMAGKIEKAFEALSEHNYFKAKELFEKVKDNKPVAASYGLCYIYSTNNNPFYNLDSARHYILRSEEFFNQTDEKEQLKLKEVQVDSIRIQVLKSKVGRLAFEEAKRGHTLLGYNRYIADYPFADELPEAISLRNQLAFEKALKKNTSKAYDDFLSLYPDAEQYNEIKRRYEKSLYLEETSSGEIAEYVNFIQSHPENPYVMDAMDMIYAKSIDHNTVDEYARFIKNHPENRNVDKAWRVLYALYMKEYSQERMAEFRLDYPNYPFTDELMKDFSLSFSTFYPIRHDGKWGFIDSTGKTMIAPKYEWVSEFNEGLAMISKKGKIGFIDKAGELKIPAMYDEAEVFKNGYAVVVNDEKYGVINKANLVHIPFIYDEIGEFVDNIAYFKKGDKYGYINEDNKEVVDPVYDGCGDFKNGYAYVEINGKYGVIDRKGEIVIPVEYEWLETFKDGIARVKLDGKYGMYNTFGTLITDTVYYDNLGVFSDGLCLAAEGEKHGYLDQTGELKIDMDYDFELAALNWGQFENGYAKVKIRDKFAMIDTLGQRFLPAVFEDIGGYSDELIAVKKRGKWGFCDGKARLIIPYRYEYAWGFIGDSLSRVRKDDKMGYINKEGNEEIYVEYDDISDFIKGRAKAMKNGKYGLIDRKNNVVVPFEHSEMKYIENLIQTTRNDLMNYINPRTGVVIWRETR